MTDQEPDWKALAQQNANFARYFRDLAARYHQELQALKFNEPENDQYKRIRYTDRTGDTAARRADRRS